MPGGWGRFDEGGNVLPQKGSGKPVSRRSFAELVVELVGLRGADMSSV